MAEQGGVGGFIPQIPRSPSNMVLVSVTPTRLLLPDALTSPVASTAGTHTGSTMNNETERVLRKPTRTQDQRKTPSYWQQRHAAFKNRASTAFLRTRGQLRIRDGVVQL